MDEIEERLRNLSDEEKIKRIQLLLHQNTY